MFNLNNHYTFRAQFILIATMIILYNILFTDYNSYYITDFITTILKYIGLFNFNALIIVINILGLFLIFDKMVFELDIKWSIKLNI